jgi:hypothetical protein
MTLSRNQKFEIRKLTKTNLVPNRHSGVGNVSEYIKSALRELPSEPTRAADGRYNGIVSPRSIANDPQSLRYLTDRVNRIYDTTGKLPSIETIKSWI